MLHTFKNIIFTTVIFLAHNFAHGAESQSIYFGGYVRHFQPQAETNEGNMNFIGYSREYKFDNWQLEPGINTYVDSYGKQSFSAFVDISHARLSYPYFKPILTLSCMHKGTDYNSDEMTMQCYPFVKFRVGDDKKLFANIVPIPHVKGITNGFIAIEVGYRW